MIVTLISVVSYAQKKGDMNVGFSIYGSAGKLINQSFDDEELGLESQPLNSLFGIGVELAYFAKDNLRLGVALGMPYTTSPIDYENGDWKKVRTIGFSFNPNISYYVKLADKFYYTPEFGIAIEAGTMKEDAIANFPMHIDGYFGWSSYISFIAFEYQISPRFSMAAGCGSLGYSSVKELQCDIKTGQFYFKLNQASLSARFYF